MIKKIALTIAMSGFLFAGTTSIINIESTDVSTIRTDNSIKDILRTHEAVMMKLIEESAVALKEIEELKKENTKMSNKLIEIEKEKKEQAKSDKNFNDNKKASAGLYDSEFKKYLNKKR